MSTATFQRKCRKCGEVYVKGSVNEEFARQYLADAISKGTTDIPFGALQITREETHSCGGVSDLIGYTVRV